MVPTPPVIVYYSNLVFKEPFRTLLFTIARTDLAVCAHIQFIFCGLTGFPETFNHNSRSLLQLLASLV